MNVKINKSIANGTVAAPPSKSMAHRYIISAALSCGECTVSNISYSEDIKATLDCIKALGIGVTEGQDSVSLSPEKLVSSGDKVVFPCRESGSTMRFFMGISMALGLDATFLGSETLRNRPMGIYEGICEAQDIEFIRNADSIKVNGQLNSGEYSLAGNISSQFITGLLFGLPLLENDSVINLIPPVESRSYINLTLQALGEFGVTVMWAGANRLIIPGGQRYEAKNAVVEGDYSNAAFLDAFNTIGGKVVTSGLVENSLQGDRVYKEHYKRLMDGMCEVDISDCPDLGPVLFSVAAANHGGIFTGTKRLQIKESDRGRVMCEELAKFGVKTEYSEDSIKIYSGLNAPDSNLDGHNDHRIVMSMALLSSVTGGTITGAQAVNKSYPTFFEDIKSLGIEVTEDGVE